MKRSALILSLIAAALCFSCSSNKGKDPSNCSCNSSETSEPGEGTDSNDINPDPSDDDPDEPDIEPDEPDFPAPIEPEFNLVNLDLENNILIKKGNWTFTGNSGSISSTTYANQLAITNVRLDANQDLEFKADVTISDGYFHLVFGIDDYQYPSNGFYAFSINSSGVTRLSSEGKGYLGYDSDAHAYQIPSFVSTNSYTIKVRCYSSGRIMTFVNNTLTCDTYDINLQHGYIGFCNYHGNATFQNVQYSIRDGYYDSFEIKDLSPYKVQHHRTSYNWGTWSFSENIISASNSSIGDHFSMSTIHQKPNQNLIFEGEVDTQGNSSGFVFGVDKIQDPSAGWYAFAFSRDNKNIRAFSVNKGQLGTGNKSQKNLNDAELAMGFLKLKIIARANGFLSFYLNDELVAHIFDKDYNGGYIGFNTFYASSTFRNMSIKLTDDVVNISDLDIEGLDINYQEDKHAYIEDVNTSIKSLNIKVLTKEFTNIFIDEIKTKSKRIRVYKGDNMVEIKSEDAKTKKTGYVNVLLQSYYAEDNRPQIHYTPKNSFMNDPNGLMYDEVTGKYHMFYQYHSTIDSSGEAKWEHLESTDLFHWKNKGIAIYPRKGWGVAFSGSGVIDRNNTSGLFNDTVPEGSRMVTIVTYHSDNPSIGLCYSLDQGETWIEYPQKIIPNTGNMYGNHFRDPKVVWYQDDELCPDGTWLMITGGWTVLRLFSSEDLLHWNYLGTVNDINGVPIESECPDLFPMYVNNDPESKVWVVTTGGTGFVVGNFINGNSGIEFQAISGIKNIFNCNNLWSNTGESYATQSFYNDKENRRILVSWLVDDNALKVPDKVWNGGQSIPLETSLLMDNEYEFTLKTYPVTEINSLRENKKAFTLHNRDISENTPLMITSLSKNQYDFDFTFSNVDAQELYIDFCYKDDSNRVRFIYNFLNQTASINVTKQGNFNSYTINPFVLKMVSGKISLRAIIDVVFYEMFGNGGMTSSQGMMFIDPYETNIRISCFNGSVHIDSLDIWMLNSIFN